MSGKNIDSRNIKSGKIIPVENYSDQPYVVKTDDGGWLLVVTTGAGTEGATGQHVISMKSFDKGETWCNITDVEKIENPESSYAVLYKTSFGRVYCFYNYNADNLREVIADDPPFKGGKCTRVDTQGHFVFKYSDDHGKSWSEKWYEIPQRLFDVDRNNPYGGKILYFWNVGKPLEINGGVCVPIYKIKKFGDGFMTNSEGALLQCSTINDEKDPEKLVWKTLPDGDFGIKADDSISKISEEHSFVRLSDNSIFCVFRTISGSSYCCYSRDGGHSFTKPEPMRYANGRKMKHPRAANFIWKCENGNYLYWFHNHGGTWYDDRNPAWLSGALEYPTADGMCLKFSQPEPVLYDDDVVIRMSYPDLVEEDGAYYITETQKNLARVHLIDKTLIEGLWKQFEKTDAPKEGISLQNGSDMPKIKPLIERDHTYPDERSKSALTSFCFEFDVTPKEIDAELFSTLNEQDNGLCAVWNAKLELITFYMNDGRRAVLWDCDKNMLEIRKTHHVSIIVDGGANLIEFVIDGVLCDGGTQRQFGFGRFDKYLLDINGKNQISVGDSVKNLTLYQRLITVSEAVEANSERTVL